MLELEFLSDCVPHFHLERQQKTTKISKAESKFNAQFNHAWHSNRNWPQIINYYLILSLEHALGD